MSRDVRTFVCFGSRTVEMHGGDRLVAGRSARCDLVLDDDLASREHCRLSLVDGRVYVEDLGSRNGLLVNGMAVDGRLELHHGDQLTAGRTPITILRQSREPRLRSSASLPVVELDEPSDQVTAAGNLVELLGGSARRALEEKDLMVAERTTMNLFGLLRRAARGRQVRAEEVGTAAGLALDLAERTEDAGWLGRVLELCVAAGHPIGRHEAARFVELAQRVGPPDRALPEYLELAQSHGGGAVATLCEQLIAERSGRQGER